MRSPLKGCSLWLQVSLGLALGFAGSMASSCSAPPSSYDENNTSCNCGVPEDIVGSSTLERTYDALSASPGNLDGASFSVWSLPGPGDDSDTSVATLSYQDELGEAVTVQFGAFSRRSSCTGQGGEGGQGP